MLVALSGGLDSVVLLHRLREAGLQVIAAHFDHRMRPESGDDAQWVRALCEQWKVPLVCGVAQESLRSEAAAREARYTFLKTAADAQGARWILTAHHADDQAETVLMRLLRGTGLDGLAGIPRRRGRFVRPLLGERRAELEAYARARGLTWREDPSNRDVRYLRNRVRHELLPQLERDLPAATEELCRVARAAARARRGWRRVERAVLDAVVIAQTHDTVELARFRLLGYHPEIRIRLIRAVAALLERPLSRSGTAVVESFINAGESGSGVTLKGGLRVEREFDTLRMTRSPVRAGSGADQPLWIERPGTGSGVAVLDGQHYSVEWTLDPHGRIEQAPAFDPARLRFPLQIRSWQPGDRIRLSYGSVKLKKLFGQQRIGRSARKRVPIMADADGQVLWIAGVAHAEGASPAAEVFRIQVIDGDSD